MDAQAPGHAALPSKQALLDEMRGSAEASFILVVLPDRDDDDLDRGEQRRGAQPLVVPVRHDQSADETRRDSPARVPGEVHATGLCLELEVERLREVLPEIVRCAGLQCLVVLHHPFAGVGAQSPSKSFGVGFGTGNDRHRHPPFHKIAVDAEHPSRFLLGFLMRRVSRMSLLPEELERAQKQSRPHLPADNVCPLIDEDREVAIALHPFRVHRVDDRLGCRPDHQRLLQLLPAPVSNDGQLGSEPLDVLRLLLHEALGDEQRKVRVLVPGILEHHVELLLHPFPDAVAARPDDHATPDGRVVRQLAPQHDFVVPGTEVFRPLRQFLVVSHCLSYSESRNASRATLRSDPSASVLSVTLPFA